MATIRGFCSEARGATSIEYALIAGFISILIVVGATTIGANLSAHYFTPLATKLT